MLDDNNHKYDASKSNNDKSYPLTQLRFQSYTCFAIFFTIWLNRLVGFPVFGRNLFILCCGASILSLIGFQRIRHNLNGLRLSLLLLHTPVFGFLLLHHVAGDRVEIDETYFRDSNKGYRKGTMPRPARKSGRKAAKRGLSKQQVCVVTGIDDTGTSFLVVSGRGMLGKERAYKVLNGRIGKGALVVTDKAGAYPTVIDRLGAALERTDAAGHAINRINSLHVRLKDFMHGFKGVSTKHLQSYLAWFQWTEAFKSGPAEQRGTVGRQIRNGVYRLTRSMYVRMPMPV